MAKVIGEGTIVQLEKDKPKSKCRKWQLRVPVGLDPRTGKYKTRTRRVNDMTYTPVSYTHLRPHILTASRDIPYTGSTAGIFPTMIRGREERSHRYPLSTSSIIA